MKQYLTLIIALLLLPAIALADTGGTVSTILVGATNYTVHVFNSSGTYNVTANRNIEVLIVGGGGSGGGGIGGGGGAGGLYYNSSYPVSAGTYTITVGNGGTAGGADAHGTSGQNSSLGSLIAVGGGYGGDYVTPGAAGGSGGGGGRDQVGGTGTTGQGFLGGSETGSGNVGGGGGGSSQAGQNVSGVNAGNGGNGTLFNLTGTPQWFAGGGGGGAYTAGTTAGRGGLGGGANGSQTDASPGVTAQSGLPNTGGGGGGGPGNGGLGGAGGSGIIILRYVTSSAVTVNNSITFLNQSPSQITTTNLFSIHPYFTYNYSSNATNPVYYNFTVNDNALSCVNLVNGTCLRTTGQTATVINTITQQSTAQTVTFDVDENTIYPALYNKPDSQMSSLPHTNFTLVATSDYISTEIYNMSNATSYNTIEVYAANVAGGTARIYACNSSYSFVTGVNVATSPFCNNFANIASTTFNHSDNFSLHQVNDVPIANGGINGIKITPVMYFMIRGVAANTRVGYVANITRANTTRTTTNDGNAWTIQPWTVDLHLHQLGLTPYITMQACGNYTSNVPNGTVCSTYRNATIALTAIPPSPPTFVSPVLGQNFSRYINITYTSATPSTNQSNISTYTISLLNSDGSVNQTIVNNGLNLSYVWDYSGANLSLGQYAIRVTVNDTLGLSSFSDSELFNIITDSLLTINVKDLLTNATVTNYTVTVVNSTAGINANITTTNATVYVPVIKGYTYSLRVDATSYAIGTQDLPVSTNFPTTTVYLAPTNSVFIYAYDETTLVLLNTINTTVTMTSGSTFLNQTSGTGSFLFQNLTAGSWTVVVSPAGYASKTYFLTVTDRGTQTLNAFLGQTTISIVFKVKDSVTGNTIENATFTIQSLVGANYVTVAQTVTDAFGQAVFSLIPLKQYQFIINANNYAPKNGMFNTVIANYVVLIDANNTQNYISFLNDYSYRLSPEMVSANSTTFSLTANCPSGCLNWFAVVVNYNGTNQTANVTGSPSGGVATVTINFENITGMMPVSATYYVKSVNLNETIVIGKTWVLYGGFGRTNYTLVNFLEYYGAPSSPIDMTTRGILVTIVAALLAAGAGIFLGGGVAMMTAATVFAIAGMFGWLSIGITIVTVGALVGLLLLGGRA